MLFEIPTNFYNNWVLIGGLYLPNEFVFHNGGWKVFYFLNKNHIYLCSVAVVSKWSRFRRAQRVLYESTQQ